MTTEGLSRRHALTGAATVGLGLPLLAACGGDDGGDTASDPAGSTSDGGSASTPSGDGGALATTADIAVGGGVIFADQKVVVTQPSEGDFKAFSAVCTHQGCTVGSVADGTINCPCHGSEFSIEDGSVQAGPATSSLGEVELDIQGDQINLA
jgi:Rieske Fe-S protein